MRVDINAKEVVCGGVYVDKCHVIKRRLTTCENSSRRRDNDLIAFSGGKVMKVGGSEVAKKN